MSIEKELIPQFETEEQEAEYWETHSPLDLVAEPEAQKVRVRGAKDRPITIRLDSESRLKLAKLAAERGLGPSTFARLILMSIIEYKEKLPKVITLDQLKEGFEDILGQMPQAIKERVEALTKAIAIGDSANPALLVIDARNRKEWEEITWSFWSALLAMAGVQVIAPEDSKYKDLKSIVGKRGG